MDIKIAPDLDEVFVSDTSIWTKWNGGVEYCAALRPLRILHGDLYLMENFRTAIALCSKPWQVERLLNDFFHVNGSIQ